MLRIFKTLRHSIRHDLPQLERCHRVDCPCVNSMYKSMAGSAKKPVEYQDYNKCLALSKKWQQKWPKT